MSLIITTILLFYCKWENGKRAAGKRDDRLQQEHPEMLGYRHPEFKYTL
jgi:hypothetical protein